MERPHKTALPSDIELLDHSLGCLDIPGSDVCNPDNQSQVLRERVSNLGPPLAGHVLFYNKDNLEYIS